MPSRKGGGKGRRRGCQLREVEKGERGRRLTEIGGRWKDGEE